MTFKLLLLLSLIFYPLYASSYDNNALSEAFITGSDTDGKPFFLCIGKLYGSKQPGKTWPGYGRCNIPYDGKEYIVDRFETPSRAEFRRSHWQKKVHSAVKIGHDSNGTPLFLCQTWFQGSRQPGKTWPGYNHCNISYDGRELITDNYTVLTATRDKSSNIYILKSTNTVAKCLNGNFGDKACGYNCVRSLSRVACAKTPDQKCLADKFGRISCGYGCAKSSSQVACASLPGEHCVVNQFNELRCGKN